MRRLRWMMLAIGALGLGLAGPATAAHLPSSAAMINGAAGAPVAQARFHGGFGHRGFGHRGFGHRGFGHRGFGHRGFGLHRGFGYRRHFGFHRGFGHRRRFYGGYGGYYGRPRYRRGFYGGYGLPYGGYGYRRPYYRQRICTCRPAYRRRFYY